MFKQLYLNLGFMGETCSSDQPFCIITVIYIDNTLKLLGSKDPLTGATDLQSVVVSWHSPMPGHGAWRVKCRVDFNSSLILLTRYLV